jgi:hypothetical protein
MKTDQTKVFFRYDEKRTITAVAKNVQTNEEIATRKVKLRHGDTPNKVVGRKYAFKKLMDYILSNNLLPKPEIGQLWKLFGSTCKQPNHKLAY